jgi:hypothetical protein
VFNIAGILQRSWSTPPFSSERRLHNRAFLYWESRKNGCEFPSLGNFDVSELEDVHSHCFLLDLTLGGDPLIAHAGEILREEADLRDGRARVRDVRPTSLLGQFGGRWALVLDKRQPLTSEYAFVTPADYQISCRGVLLPLSSDGCDIDHIFGVVRWKSEKLVGDGKPHSGAADHAG